MTSCKPAMMFWDHRTLIRADLVESLTVRVHSVAANKTELILKLVNGNSKYVKTFYSDSEAYEEFNELYSKWTEAMRDR